MLPPGRARLATRLALTGSGTTARTIGMEAVARFAATAAADPRAMMTSTFCSARSVGGRASSLDYLVGAGEERGGHRETKGLCYLQVHTEADFSRPLDGKVLRLGTLEDPVNVAGCAARDFGDVG